MEADKLDYPSPPASRQDRRRRERASVHWSVQFHRQDATDLLATETQNLSSDGFFFRSKARFTTGELADCTLQIPGRRSRAPLGLVRVPCRVRIVRVNQPDSQGFYGYACRIEDYRFPPPRI